MTTASNTHTPSEREKTILQNVHSNELFAHVFYISHTIYPEWLKLNFFSVHLISIVNAVGCIFHG